MSELDKFKRRTIRSVARLLLQEKKPEEELWKQMKKETGTDCRVLWERMRALCIKKLNRMISVDDRSANLPSIARLSLTDWLLVDLVLVHEDIDVIAMDREESTEHPALIELFNLVQRFKIEGASGESLAEAWAAGTVFYNRQGRQCSPMLLQRRWYQLKKLVRCRFYKFWFAYRGNTRLLEEARKCMPTRLQMAIARRYPQMITGQFKDWEELIETRFVIMPEEFEAKMRMPNLPKPCSSNAPDLVLVEPVIETIDVESEPEDQNDDDMEDNSDSEKSNDATDITCPHATDETTPDDTMATEEQETVINEDTTGTGEQETVINKDTMGTEEQETVINEEVVTEQNLGTEPIEEDGLSNVQLSSATHVPEIEIPDDPDESPEISPNQDDRDANTEYSLMDNNADEDEDDIIEMPSVVPAVNVDLVEMPSVVSAVNVNLEVPKDNVVQTVAEASPNNITCEVETINDSDEGIDDIIKVKADAFCSKATEVVPVESTIDDLIKDKVETFLKKPKEDMSLRERNPDVSNINLLNKEVAAIDLMADLNFVDDGIEFVDDGVEFVEEDTSQKIDPTKNTPAEQTEETAEQNKFDLKLLLYPVVYTTKLDQMKTFTNIPFTTVENKEDIEMAFNESKPISRHTFSMKIKQESVIEVQQQTSTSVAEDTTESDDLFTNQEASDDEQLDEDAKVSTNSYMLKKPRTRTYDLIKLCKNPDFNTKLKRLTIGFLSSTRNRQLLKACIPMTIDLSKAFETKLVNKTLYLKSSGTSQIVVKQEVIDDKQASSIVPTAMPVQSLINNSKVDIQNLISNQPPEPMVPERTKIIKLPDIEKVRRINQQLLTAEVPPLRVYSGNGHRETPPVPPPPNQVQATKDHTHEANLALSSFVPAAPIEPVIETTSLNTPPVKIKIEGEKSSTTEAVTTPSETLPPAKQKLLKMINQAKITTQEALAKIDDGIKEDDFPMPIVVNEVKANIPLEAQRKPWYRPREQLAWAPKYTKQPKNLDDFGLLTSDTLNKMLHLLMSGSDGTGCDCCTTKSKAKKKKKTQSETAKPKEPDTSKKKQDNNSEPVQKDENAPKNPQTDQVPPEGETTKSKEQKAKSKLVVLGRVVKYCCWAKEKIWNRKRITKHRCPPGDCKCCCAEELALKTAQNLQTQRDKEIQSKELELKKKDVAIELSDEEDDSLKNACESIDNVVQQSRDGTNNNFGQVETPAVQSIGTRPVTSSNIVSPTSSPVKVSVAVGPDTSPSEFPSVTRTKPLKAPFIQTIRAASVASLMPQQPPAPRVKVVVSRPQTVQSKTWVPLSCQRPAVSQDFRRSIVIDASVSCPRHPTPIAPTTPVVPTPIVTTPIAPKPPVPNLTPIAPKTEKVLYLHSKSIAKSPSDSPIFLGKNKILLTTVKFPRKDEDVPAAEVVAPKIIPTLPLPAGVQLVLLPSGNVTYTLDPGVELDEAQLATLPTILAAVQEQINSTGPVISSDIVEPQINTTGEVQPVTALPPEMSVPENTTLPPSGETIGMPPTVGSITETVETSPITLTTNEVIQDPELPAKNPHVVDMEVDTDSTNIDASASQETATNVAEEVIVNSEETVNEVTVDSEAPSEDIVNEVTVDSEAPKDTTELAEHSQVKETKVMGPGEEINDNRKSLLSDLMEMSGISAEDTIAPESVVPQPVTNLQNTANIAGNDELRNLPELSPVTSFAELKYACEQDGKFFKLDFETGVIVPINVCIKKNTKKKPIVTKECIDLTDDADTDVAISTAQETAISQDSQRKAPVEYIYKGQTVTVPAVKPVKLFKAFRPTPNVLRMKRHLKTRGYSPISLNIQTHVEKRKQSLLKPRVEARIDLVDSEEEPMEEEYLVDSSDDDSRKESMQIEALDPFTQSDDSSDDEPLAKKSKRLKEVEEVENIRETNIYDDVPADPNELTLKDVASVIDTQREKVILNSTLPPAPMSTDIVPSISVSVRSDIASPIENSNSPSKVTVPSNVPVDYEMFPDESDDEELDKTRPEIRFMSDPSDSEGGDDCILGV